jgi:hypothetical protein
LSRPARCNERDPPRLGFERSVTARSLERDISRFHGWNKRTKAVQG